MKNEYRIELSFEDMRNIFGERDNYIKKIEKELNVSIINRDEYIKVCGEDSNAKKAVSLISELTELSHKGNSLNEQNINYGITLSKENNEKSLGLIDDSVICHTVSGKPVKPMTLGQREYVNSIKNNMIVFGLGPAGTGKTYLAMAMAITAFKNEEVSRIILTRPAIEAGEKLGYLPGDLQSLSLIHI